MFPLVRSALVATSLALAACSLLVPLDDLTNGSSGGPDGSALAPPGVDGSSPSEAGAPPVAFADAGFDAADAASSEYRDLVVSHTPLAYWRLADREGETATDEMANAHPGLYYGGYQLGVAGMQPGGAATRFNGTSACVYVGDYFQFANRQPFSVEAWIRPTAFGSGARIVSTEGPGGGAVRSGWSLMYNDPGAAFFEGWADNGQGASNYVLGVYSGESAGGPLALGAWTHLVATFDTSEETIWVDGVLRGRVSQSQLSLPDSAEFAIGCGGDGTGSIQSGVTGDLSDVAIYDRVLAEVQITAHAALGHRPSP